MSQFTVISLTICFIWKSYFMQFSVARESCTLDCVDLCSQISGCICVRNCVKCDNIVTHMPQEPHFNQDSHTECYMLTVHSSHTLFQIPSHGTHNFSKKMIQIPLENPCMCSSRVEINVYSNYYMGGGAPNVWFTCGN